MSKIFYDHLIIFEEVVEIFDAHNLTDTEKNKLLSAVDELFHQQIMEEILSHLPQDKHEDFLKRFLASPNDRTLMTFLNTHSQKDIEKKILIRANKVKKNIARLIKKNTLLK